MQLAFDFTESRSCLDCGANLNGTHGNRRYCPACRRARKAAYDLEWARANPGKLLDAQRRYRDRHPEARRACNQRRRARLLQSAGVTYVPWKLRYQVMCHFGYRCLACGATDDVGLDHIQPVEHGGPTTFANLQPLCPSCNSKKGDRMIDFRDNRTDFQGEISAQLSLLLGE